jgi:hypothetical protein
MEALVQLPQADMAVVVAVAQVQLAVLGRVQLAGMAA